jgi:hypothetical protein
MSFPWQEVLKNFKKLDGMSNIKKKEVKIHIQFMRIEEFKKKGGENTYSIYEDRRV